MKIFGLQKMTLLDFPGHVACTVFLSGCGLRCPFCHNFDLALGRAPAVMEEEELLAFLSRRRGLLDGVAISGGEPCLHGDLPRLMRDIRALGFRIKLDTNGCHPALLARILSEGLADYVAMDIKNSPEKYAVTCGLSEMDLSPVRESVSLLMSGGVPYEFRTTVVREFHEEKDFAAIGEWIRGAGAYFLQPFVDRDAVPFSGLHAPEKEQLRLFAAAAGRFVRSVRVRGEEI